MSQKKKKKKKNPLLRHLTLTVVVCMLLTTAICFGAWQWLANLLPSQKAAQRWQGDGDLPFSQITCFLPADQTIGLKEVSTFRNEAAKKLEEAALDVQGDARYMLDAWSTTGKVYTDGKHGRGEASVIAVGGDYFDFHPLRLLSGDYIRQSDLMKDRIILSEDVAWMLFGGTDLAGMTMKLNGIPFVIAGVVAPESDFASKKANSDTLDLYMSYDMLLQMDENTSINCYELILANPVKNFAMNVVRDKFPIGRGEILCNTTRYDYGEMLGLIGKFGSRGSQISGAVLPYWENAARMTENWGSLCCLLGTLLPIFPLVTGAVLTGRNAKKLKGRLEEDILPDVQEKVSEAIRVRQRRHWERVHGEHEK